MIMDLACIYTRVYILGEPHKKATLQRVFNAGSFPALSSLVSAPDC